MKTRILALTLTLVMLLCMVPFSAFAAEPIHFEHDATVDANNVITYHAAPAGAKTTNGVTKVPEIRTPLAATTQEQLDAIHALRDKVISIGLTTTQTAEKPTAEADAHKTTGFSIIGVKAFNTGDNAKAGAANAVDGDWIDNNVRFTSTGELYNVSGTSLANKGANDKASDYRYVNLYTFNFGKAKLIEAVGFIGDNCNRMPQSADIYVSNDGETWTLVGYYDRLGSRASQHLKDGGADYAPQTITGDETWKSSDGLTTARTSLMYYELPEVQTAQYVRIAATTYSGANDGNVDPSKGVGIKNDLYHPYTPGVGTHKAETDTAMAYEFLVFGEAAPATAITELPTFATPEAGKNLATDVTLPTDAGYTAGKITWTDDENNAATAAKAGYTYTGVVTLTIADAEDHFFTTEGLTLADGVTATVSEDKLTMTLTYTYKVAGEKETEPAETEPVTNAPATNETPADDTDAGCKSVVGGMSALLLLAGAAVAFVAKKKED